MFKILGHSACCLAVFSNCASPSLLTFSLASPSPLFCICFNKIDATCTSPCEDKPHIWRENCSLQICLQSQKNSPLQKGFFNTQCAYAKISQQILLTSFLHWTNRPAGSCSCCSWGGNGINWVMEAIEVANVLCFFHLLFLPYEGCGLILRGKTSDQFCFFLFLKSASKWNKKLCTGMLTGLCFPSSLKASSCLVFYRERGNVMIVATHMHWFALYFSQPDFLVLCNWKKITKNIKIMQFLGRKILNKLWVKVLS